MSRYGDDAVLAIYYRAFEIAEDGHLDPDPDRDGYLPANTAGFPPRSRAWPPRPPQEAQERGEDHELRQERDDLKAALKDALATNRDQAARLADALFARDLWRVGAIALAVILCLHMLVR